MFKSNDTAGGGTTIIANLSGQLLNSVCVNHATGGYVVAEFSGGTRLTFLARDGTVIQTVTGITNMSGVDFNVWDSNIYVSRFGGSTTAGVMRVTQTGTTSSVTSGSVTTATNNSVEVFDQPQNRLLCSELGGSPQFLTIIDPTTGSITTLHTSSGVFGFSDADIYRSKKIWATNAWKAGSAGQLSVNFGPQFAGQSYLVALSLGYSPGIPLGALGTVHLIPDGLFVASLILGPPLFNNFQGTLDGSGKASPAPFVNIPAGLSGVRVYGGAIAFTNQGVTAVSNLWGITIQ